MEFTKQQAKVALESLNELFEAIPKSRRFDYLGPLNEASLFIETAARVAPDKEVKRGGHAK